MFGESRRIAVAVIVGIIVAILLFGYALWQIIADYRDKRDAIQTASSTTVYVNPADYPGWQPTGGMGVAGGTGSNTQSGTGSGDTTPNVSGSAGSGSTSGGIRSWLPSLGGSKSVPTDLPNGYTAQNLSAQFRKVRISSVANREVSSTNAPEVTLSENIGSGDAAVTVTGWQIKTNSDTFTLPRAAKVYKTTGSSLSPITLANGQSVLVIGNTTPIGAHFMGNSCMGYLNQQFSFVPQLRNLCERPTKMQIQTFSGACQNYIFSLNNCAAGNASDARIPSDDAACRSYIADLNYDGCVTRNQSNANFSTNIWNVWAGKPLVDPLHDQVLLLDGSGKLVDYYVY
jgi:hypothetical protein